MTAPSKKPNESELSRLLDVARRLPPLSRVSVAAVLFTALGVIVWPLTSRSGQVATATGPVSNHHRLTENQCSSCHEESPFRGTPDDRCTSCHAVKPHKGVTSAISSDTEGAACVTCHREHHGQRSLVPVESPLCTSCHERIEARVPGALGKNVSSFASHPEFATVAARAGQSPSLSGRAHLSSRPRPVTALKFSHAKHLPREVGDGGSRPSSPNVACKSCHVPAERGSESTMRPVGFDAHCSRCHSIELDERAAGKRVPHGSEQRAFDAVLAGLAQYYVGRDAGAMRASTGGTQEERLEREARDLEQALYTEGKGCMKCHDVTTEAPRSGKSRYLVVPPAIPAKWMFAASFSHDRHRSADCMSCHEGAAVSVSASDVLLPGVDRCRECHADPGTPGKVESPCLECHRYHEAR